MTASSSTMIDSKEIVRRLVKIYGFKIKAGRLQHPIIDPAIDTFSNALQLTKMAFETPRKFFLDRSDRFPTHCVSLPVMTLRGLQEAMRSDPLTVADYITTTFLKADRLLLAFSDCWTADRYSIHDQIEEIHQAFSALARMGLPPGIMDSLPSIIKEAIAQLGTTVCFFGEEEQSTFIVGRFCGIMLVALPVIGMQHVIEGLRDAWMLPETLKFVARFPAAVLSSVVGDLQNLVAMQFDSLNEDPAVNASLLQTAAVISMLYNANTHLSSRGIISYKEFYNPTAIALDEDGIIHDFEISLRNRRVIGPTQLFCFSNFPCLVDAKFKSMLMHFEGVLEMQEALRNAALSSLFNQEPTNPFLNLVVRRDRLVESTIAEIQRKRAFLRNPLKVRFTGEQGVDAGGVRKEFFLLLMKELLDPKYGMFHSNDERNLWFQPKARCTVSDEEFRLVGTLMGLAVFNNVILELPFPLALYRKLLGCPMDFEDLQEVDPALASGLTELLKFEESKEENLTVEDVFCRFFTFEYDAFGTVVEVELCPGGASKPLTASNREEYVTLITDLVLNTAIETQFNAFKNGFSSIADRNLMLAMHPQELELLVCGQRTFSFLELQHHTTYEGFQATDDTIVYLWQTLHSLSTDDQRLFLRFATGSDRVPIGGLKDLNFVVGKNGDDESMLPTAHTCFNHLLLPAYKSLETLRLKLLLAIQNCQGFGLR